MKDPDREHKYIIGKISKMWALCYVEWDKKTLRNSAVVQLALRYDLSSTWRKIREEDPTWYKIQIEGIKTIAEEEAVAIMLRAEPDTRKSWKQSRAGEPHGEK